MVGGYFDELSDATTQGRRTAHTRPANLATKSEFEDGLYNERRLTMRSLRKAQDHKNFNGDNSRTYRCFEYDTNSAAAEAAQMQE
jgi:hypothetical protein